PPFLKNLHPDAIALKEPGGVVIEVVTDRHSHRPRLNELRRLLEGQKDWSFEVVTAPSDDTSIRESTRAQILAALDEVAQLSAAGAYRPSFITAWAALEATVRRLQLGDTSIPERPITASQLPEMLTRHGLIDQRTSTWLRNLILTRNAVVHGD